MDANPPGNSWRRRLAAIAAAAVLTTAGLAGAGAEPLADEQDQEKQAVVTTKQVVVKAVPADDGAGPAAKARVADGKNPQAKKAESKKAVAKKTVVARKAVAAKRVVIRNANVNPMIQQYIQQGQPMMLAELIFAGKVCGLDRANLRRMYPEARKALEEVAKTLAERMNQANNQPDAMQELRKKIAEVLKKHVSDDQYRRYEAQSALRIADQRKAAARFMVDAIDRELYLSDDQRTRISDAILKNWDDRWVIYVDYLLYGNRFFPNEIDKFVTPTLTKTQKTVWGTTQRVSGFWGFGGIWMFQGNESPFTSYLEGESADLPRDVFAPAESKKAQARPK